MAHDNQQNFFKRVKDKFPDYFINSEVLDCGSLNVNGTARDLFTNCDYTGVDIVSGDGVDIVEKIHECPFADNSFDCVLTGEMLEHDEFWTKSLGRMYDFAKKGGLIMITCAGTDRPEHGTKNSGTPEWGTSSNYYRNLTPEDIQTIYKEDMFTDYHFEVNNQTHDTYFYGIKK